MNPILLDRVDKYVDCKGLSCPMPIVKTKRAIDEMQPGQVLEVAATDPGSVADVKSWALRTGHQFLGTLEESGLFRHYIRRADPTDVKEEKKHPHTITNARLQEKLAQGEVVILDVREPMEYSFGHIPGARSIPLGQLTDWIPRLKELSDQEIHVVCQTGNRSDMACQILSENGFVQVFNAVEGMQNWNGPADSEVNGRVGG